MVKPAPSKPYSTSEKVLCDHQGMMYEAKILETRTVNDELQYLVHYQGWNNRWDEWVTDERLYEYNEENLKKQQELEANKARASGGKTGGGGSQRSRASQGGGEGASGKSKTPTTGGKSKNTTGSSGPSTPFDGSSSKTGSGVGLGESAGGGLELESRASTPSVDGSASVASTSTTGQASVAQSSTKRKAGGKSKAATGGSVLSTPAGDTSQTAGHDQPETPASSEPKRKRVRPSTTTPALATPAMQPPTAAVSATVPTDLASPAPGVESFDQFRGRQEVQVKVPDDLKEVIVDDWDKITRQMKLCLIPAPKTIEDILNDYAKHKGNQKVLPGGKQNYARETVDGIREYFNEMCGVHLLYKFERPQYHDILQQQQQDENEDSSSSSADESPASRRRSRLTFYYGFPHLLRLFVRMGQMLAYTDLDQKSIDTMLGWIQELMKFLSKNKAFYFRPDDDYVVAPPEYQRKAFSS